MRKAKLNFRSSSLRHLRALQFRTSDLQYLQSWRLSSWFLTPELFSVVQRVDQFGSLFDVITEHLLVLSDPVDVTYAACQVPIDSWSQLAVPQLDGEMREENERRFRVSLNAFGKSSKLTRMFCRFQQISLMFTPLSNVTQQRLKNLKHTKNYYFL